IQSLWTFSRKQSRQEIRAIARKLKQRFVQEMFEHIVPPNIEHEGHPRSYGRDVGEVLLGADADVHTTPPRRLFQRWDDELHRVFVQHKSRLNHTAGLRKLRHHPPEFLIGYGCWKLCSLGQAGKRDTAGSNDKKMQNPSHNRREYRLTIP